MPHALVRPEPITDRAIVAPLGDDSKRRLLVKVIPPKKENNDLFAQTDMFKEKQTAEREEMNRWYADVREIVDVHCSMYGAFTTDDIRRKVLRDPVNPNRTWGAFTGKLKLWGYRVVSFTKSTGEKANGRLVCVWGK